MKLVVGLGNPGRRYARTRHNVGVRVVERFGVDHGIALDESRYDGRFGLGTVAAEAGPSGEALDVAVLAPETYMNRSGEAVFEALDGLGIGDSIEDLIVVFDDADLPFGRIRIRPRGSSGGHNGLGSVIDRVGSSEFPRLRFGIGRPDAAERRSSTIGWVLDRFSRAEERALERRVPAAADALTAFIRFGVTEAMNRYNRDPDAERPS